MTTPPAGPGTALTFGLPPRDQLELAYSYGKALAAAGYWQDARRPEQVLAKIMAGRALGLPAFTAVQEIHIIEGRPSLSARAQGMLAKRAGYSWRVLEHTDDACALEFLDADGEKLGTSRYTMDDASRAGLVRSRSAWEKAPRNMLFARAQTNGITWYCPDALAGIAFEDEITAPPYPGGATIDPGDVIDGTPADEPEAAPPPLPAARAASEDAERAAEPTITAAQRRKLFAVAREAGLDEDDLRTIITVLTGSASTERIRRSQLDEILAAVAEPRKVLGDPGPPPAEVDELLPPTAPTKEEE